MRNVLDVGGGDGSFAKQRYKDSRIISLDIKNGFDIMKLGLPKTCYGEQWDFVLVNHFIEHVADPDRLLDYCKMAMTKDTILDIGTPNLSAWFNRVFFLFGYLPHSYELSYRYNIGKPFDWNKEVLGGHIRVFNLKSILQLLKHHNFKIIDVKGEASLFKVNQPIQFLDKFLTMLNPNLASSVRILCKK